MSDCTLGDLDRLTPENPAPYPYVQEFGLSFQLTDVPDDVYYLITGGLSERLITRGLTVAERGGQLVYDWHPDTPIFNRLAAEHNGHLSLRQFYGMFRDTE